MSRQKGKLVRPLEDCLEGSQLALKDKLLSELRQEIIHSELSPDKAWREARRRLKKLRATVDLNKKDEQLASSFWWLAKTKRDYSEEFGKLTKQEEKEMGEKVKVSFLEFEAEFSHFQAIQLCNKILSQLVVSNALDEPKYKSLYSIGAGAVDQLRDLMIQILEEKFGLKVTGGQCKDCKSFDKDIPARFDEKGRLIQYDESRLCTHKAFTFGETRTFVLPDHTCGHWAPKEKEAQHAIAYSAYCQKCKKDVKITGPMAALEQTMMSGNRLAVKITCPECAGIVYCTFPDRGAKQ